jgi:cytochrome c oxidase subunit 4
MNNNHTSLNHEFPYGAYVMVWAGLVALTAITVTVAGVNLGAFTLITALLIAGAKTLMVVNYFMHVKFDKKVFKVFILVCILTYIIFLILTFTDIAFRNEP